MSRLYREMMEGEFLFADSLAPLMFFMFLVAADEEKSFIPSPTRDIRCDRTLCVWIADKLGPYQIDVDLVARAFQGQPVKQVERVAQSTIFTMDNLAEIDEYLRTYANRREEREAMVNANKEEA